MKHKMNVADVITADRIVFAILILFCSTFSVPFYACYLLGAFTDMMDGMVARRLKLKSSFGAILDTIADFIFIITVLVKVLPAINLPRWLLIWIAMIALVKFINLVSSFVTFKRIITVHTVLNKVTGFMLFLMPFSISISLWQVLTIAVIDVCAVATFAAIQEWCYIRAGKEIE